MHIYKHLSSFSPHPVLDTHGNSPYTILPPASFSPQDVLKRFPCQYMEIGCILEYRLCLHSSRNTAFRLFQISCFYSNTAAVLSWVGFFGLRVSPYVCRVNSYEQNSEPRALNSSEHSRGLACLRNSEAGPALQVSQTDNTFCSWDSPAILEAG